jgi:hypothetical protein
MGAWTETVARWTSHHDGMLGGSSRLWKTLILALVRWPGRKWSRIARISIRSFWSTGTIGQWPPVMLAQQGVGPPTRARTRVGHGGHRAGEPRTCTQ